MTPIAALYWRANNQPDAVAFVAGNDAWSYRRLATEAERLARAFLGCGLRAGDRVALRMANLPESRRCKGTACKVPEWLEVVDEIPRNALGKINRKSLLAMTSNPKISRHS
jgi:non-ribosomal peptide synthetase component E (peptide arylation enzyme)